MVSVRIALSAVALLCGPLVAGAQTVRGTPWLTLELLAQLTEQVNASARLRVTPLVEQVAIVRRGVIRSDSLVGTLREAHFTGRMVERQVSFTLELISRLETEERQWRRGLMFGLVLGVVGSAVAVEVVRQSDAISQLEGRTAGEVNALRFGVILGGAAAGAGIGYLTKRWRVIYERP
jgi:hypothetical protein